MATEEGILTLRADGTIKFVTGENGLSIQGVYAQALHEEVAFQATARIFGPSGPYTFAGHVGDRGVDLQLVGPVGRGSITTNKPVAIPSQDIKGSVEVIVD